MVYALALSLVRPSDVDDVVQDAFLRAFRNLDLLADPTRFGVWLRRITFGVAIDHVRADRARNARVVVRRRTSTADSLNRRILVRHRSNDSSGAKSWTASWLRSIDCRRAIAFRSRSITLMG